jgi:hypothetical protein
VFEDTCSNQAVGPENIEEDQVIEITADKGQVVLSHELVGKKYAYGTRQKWNKNEYEFDRFSHSVSVPGSRYKIKLS